MNSGKKTVANQVCALTFGLFLGLAIWKFGNPVILDQKISPPASLPEFWSDAWPTHWANWIFFPLAAAGMVLVFSKPAPRPLAKLLWLPPLAWLAWQFFSATKTVDAGLTAATLWQFSGCVAGYFLGAFLFGTPRALNFLLMGILAAFAFCLIRAVNQRIFEFPQSHRMLVEGERSGWTNFPAETLREMKREQVIVTTNGVDIANPVILAKFASGRVMGMLVYPNALAGAILLLLPASLALTFGAGKLRPAIRAAAGALVIFLGGAAFFWSGSKLGWLLAVAIGGLCLLRLNWPARLKMAAIAAVVILGLGIFAVRFQHYFAAGATSAGARLDYWHAALQTTWENPLLGSGPGTFQRPYAQLKSPGAEMARLAHNDYLEQFSDSGIPGGIFYLAWIVLSLAAAGKRIWKSENDAGKPSALRFAIFAGLLGWFAQGVGEFELYVPALAWTAFTLAGCLLAPTGNPFDKKPAAG